MSTRGKREASHDDERLIDHLIPQPVRCRGRRALKEHPIGLLRYWPIPSPA
jgi:hypothetical protein